MKIVNIDGQERELCEHKNVCDYFSDEIIKCAERLIKLTDVYDDLHYQLVIMLLVNYLT